MYDINPSIKYPSSNSHAKSSKTLRLYNAIDQDKFYNNSDIMKRGRRDRGQMRSQKHDSSGRWSQHEKMEKNVSVGRIKLPSTLEVQLRNPESQKSINVFNSKTQKILQMGQVSFCKTQRFKSQLEDRKMLEQQIKLLKRSIKEQVKYKDKLNIRTRHLMNEQQSIKLKVRQIELEYFRRQGIAKDLSQQCNSIINDVNYIKQQNEKVLSRIQQQEHRINGYGELIGRLKKVVNNASAEVGELRSVRLMAHKSMMNDLALMNKRQEEKQMLFQMVDEGISRNTHF